MTDEIATPFGYKKLGDCTAADLEFVIAYRKYLHARFPFAYMEHCRVAIDYMQKLIEAMNAQGVYTYQLARLEDL